MMEDRFMLRERLIQIIKLIDDDASRLHSGYDRSPYLSTLSKVRKELEKIIEKAVGEDL